MEPRQAPRALPTSDATTLPMIGIPEPINSPAIAPIMEPTTANTALRGLPPNRRAPKAPAANSSTSPSAAKASITSNAAVLTTSFEPGSAHHQQPAPMSTTTQLPGKPTTLASQEMAAKIDSKIAMVNSFIGLSVSVFVQQPLRVSRADSPLPRGLLDAKSSVLATCHPEACCSEM